jgi:hypothetical protein
MFVKCLRTFQFCESESEAVMKENNFLFFLGEVDRFSRKYGWFSLRRSGDFVRL